MIQIIGDFSREITEKALKLTKQVKKTAEKRFRPAFGCAQHPKAGRNTQQTATSYLFLAIIYNRGGSTASADIVY